MSKPIVSIIMATYNRAHFIEKSLNSIKNQSLEDWECIVIDDGSSDNTQEIVTSFINRDNRFKYFARSNGYKKGLSGCRNQGLDSASGEYIIFFDDDDLVHPKNLEVNLSCLTISKKDFCNYHKRPFFEQEPEMADPVNKKEFKEFHREHLKDFITGKRAMASCTVMWSKKCFENIRFCEDLQYAEEWECYARILISGYEGITINEVLYFNRKHSDSNTGRFVSGDIHERESMSRAARVMIANLAAYNYLIPELEKYFIRLGFKLKDYRLINELFKYTNPNFFKRFKYRGGFQLYPIIQPLFKVKAKFSQSLKILVCFGTRPEAIKMAPVIHEMRRQGIPHVVCNTGQHREMLENALQFFEIEPDYSLNLMTSNQSLNTLSAKLFSGLEEVLEKEKPDMVLVHGDTTTSVMAAWASFHNGIPVAHVEAGLRTYQKSSPFPEEINRQVTAKLADIHFAPTAQAKENLENEKIDPGTIMITGNTVVDALEFGKTKLEEITNSTFISRKLDVESLKYILVTGHRRENFGAGFEEICEALLELKQSESIDVIYPVHLNPNVKDQVYRKLGKTPGIHLIDPVNYPEMLWLMMNCEFIISDSGGIQEEAPALGKKILVTRDFSERIEGVQTGFSILVGRDRKKIVAEAKKLLQHPFDPGGLENPFGDGKAANPNFEIYSVTKTLKISKKLKNEIKGILNRLPYVRTLHELNENTKFPAGHYYSPVVSLKDIKQRQYEIWPHKENSEIEGIDLNATLQLKVLKKLSKYYSELPFPVRKTDGFRFNYFNSYYSYTDAIVLFGIIRNFTPERIIEIGSGYSSALMLDTNEMFFQGKIELTFIEPYSQDRLDLLIGDATDLKLRKIEKNIQNVPVEIFKELQENDILFVDSTHVVKTGSDVNYVLFEILPQLKKGVLIHFHDIHFPFEYPKDWVLNGFGWNETYFLRTFMMYNFQFEIVFFADYLHKYHKDAFAKMPLTYKSTGSNFWIRKL